MPDYGTPGNPNMDPYYISPEQEKELEREAQEKEDNLRDAIVCSIADEQSDLWRSTVVRIVRDVLLSLPPTAGEPAWINEKLDAKLREVKT